MSKRKPRLLWCGEASFLNTGYSVYAREVLSRLYNTGKYEIAELGCYGLSGDERSSSIPWRYYGNLPTEDQREVDEYNSMSSYQFGEWRFEDVLLDFKPDIVCDIRDWWMIEYQQRSVYRDFYHWMIMPTIDSAPQQEEWLATYMDADTVFTYSEYGRDVLNEEAGSGSSVADICSPGANLEKFFPVDDKIAHRAAHGFQDDVFIIGTVMRNQKRKLYPELISAFSKYIKTYPEESKDVFLYLHTTYPDHGWDIPRLIRESSVCDRILMTYKCNDCGFVFPSFFQESLTSCVACGKLEARPPSAQDGVTTEQLCDIMNFFDVYVQYSICEGVCMPQVEAACCGVPVMSVDYSAMESVVRKIDGYPIKVKTLFRELETHSLRAYPDNDDLIDKLREIINTPYPVRMAKGKRAYDCAVKNYSWDESAKNWESAIDSVRLRPHSETCGSPPRIVQPPTNPPENLSNEEFIKWGIQNLWGNNRVIDSFTALRILRELNQGFIVSNNQKDPLNIDESLLWRKSFYKYGRQKMVDDFMQLGEIRNYWESVRVDEDRKIPYYIADKKLGEREE